MTTARSTAARALVLLLLGIGTSACTRDSGIPYAVPLDASVSRDASLADAGVDAALPPDAGCDAGCELCPRSPDPGENCDEVGTCPTGSAYDETVCGLGYDPSCGGCPLECWDGVNYTTGCWPEGLVVGGECVEPDCNTNPPGACGYANGGDCPQFAPVAPIAVAVGGQVAAEPAAGAGEPDSLEGPPPPPRTFLGRAHPSSPWRAQEGAYVPFGRAGAQGLRAGPRITVKAEEMNKARLRTRDGIQELAFAKAAQVPPLRREVQPNGKKGIYTPHEEVAVELIPGTRTVKTDANGMPIFKKCEVTVQFVPWQDHVTNSSEYHVVWNGQQVGGTKLVELMYLKHPAWFKKKKANPVTADPVCGPSCLSTCVSCCDDSGEIAVTAGACLEYCTDEDDQPVDYCPAPAPEPL